MNKQMSDTTISVFEVLFFASQEFNFKLCEIVHGSGVYKHSHSQKTASQATDSSDSDFHHLHKFHFAIDGDTKFTPPVLEKSILPTSFSYPGSPGPDQTKWLVFRRIHFSGFPILPMVAKFGRLGLLGPTSCSTRSPRGWGCSSNGRIRPPGQVGILHAEQRQRQRAVLLPRTRREVFFIFGCFSKNRGILPPKMDGENSGKILWTNGWFGVPLFLETPISKKCLSDSLPPVCESWICWISNFKCFEEKQHNFWRFSLSLHPRKLTWQGKTSHLKMYLLFKMVIFHWHVSFLGGKFFRSKLCLVKPRSPRNHPIPPSASATTPFPQKRPGLVANHDKHKLLGYLKGILPAPPPKLPPLLNNKGLYNTAYSKGNQWFG